MGNVPIPAAFVPVDSVRLERLARFLHNAALVEAGYTEQDRAWAGSSGSAADRDRRWTERGVPTDKTTRAVDTTYAAARLGLIAVTDHAASLARLITDANLIGCLAVEAVARSAVETAARSWWLVEPGLLHGSVPVSAATQAGAADHQVSWGEQPLSSSMRAEPERCW
jgi:hypothetical protein